MIKSFLWIPCAFFAVSLTLNSPVYTPNSFSLKDSTENSSVSLASRLFNHYVDNIYQTCALQNSGLDVAVLKKAITGYYNLKLADKITSNSCIITIVDLAKSSCTKRMWIIDLQKQKLLLNTWVAHGQNSGADVASHFSNNVDSFESSIGFYVTDKVYMGKHGRSLKLNGMDEGFNDRANERDIVLHAAPYVCEASIKELGRLGRSQGCPAVSPLLANKIIDTIKGKNLLFINGNDGSYSSKYLNPDMAVRIAFQDNDSASSANAML
ncbi:L,D-transpeptidase-like protein [Mucilaginibacter gracilis]|uniref:L,D-transpeptidase-like protein n=1 Tax=Mucilaginibacter gracilis TaxID=423350 RepID=A0A495IWW4_9SPHI|nr:murein L,D-transpeptidase catalytic domain family protein [Mucilaginibacter gracilis]RKR81227.1 L,D-transpeptidase-like protein [Mucilaginibacter gracilis]